MAMNRPGPKPGYKQSAEHIRKRIKHGPEHPNWVGDAVSAKGGRTRAQRMYEARPCERCRSEKAERHHRDADTSNNAPENIQFLYRRCHMEEDGRLEAFRGQATERRSS